MSHSFTVNGKEYLPSTLLAVSFGYTSDYIGKLAREEKILGTQVGRQWFVEPESLKIFLQKSEVEKELRKQELRLQRKNEHASFQKKVIVEKNIPSSLTALALVCAIVACGIFVGSLSWITVSEGVGVVEVATGFSELQTLIGQGVSPVHAIDQLQRNAQQFLATTKKADGVPSIVSETVSIGDVAQPETHEVFTQLPSEVSILNVGATHTATATKGYSIGEQFSDEVQLRTTASGTQMIAPVFRKNASSSMLFMLVPVTATHTETIQ